MPVHGYFGAPGSGKSYELVNTVMVEGVRAGRVIYHNISGIDPDAWAVEFGCDPASIRQVNDDWFVDDSNFPANDDEFAAGVGVLKGGELIICDEATTIFPRGTGRNSVVSPRLDSFLRKHRHFVGPCTAIDGGTSILATDIYVATQDHQSIHSTLLHLMSLRLDFEELKSVFGKNAYKATVYKSHRATKANRHKKPMLRRTNAKGFARYHSFAGGEDADIAKTEKSAEVWNWKTKVGAALIPVAVIGGLAVAGLSLADLFASKAEAGDVVPVPQNSARGSEPVQLASVAFDPNAELEGRCVQFLLDEEGGTYFDGSDWKPYRVIGNRYQLDGCWIER